jgi:proteasome lid subunit RPN8/RPN11
MEEQMSLFDFSDMFAEAPAAENTAAKQPVKAEVKAEVKPEVKAVAEAEEAADADDESAEGEMFASEEDSDDEDTPKPAAQKGGKKHITADTVMVAPVVAGLGWKFTASPNQTVKAAVAEAKAAGFAIPGTVRVVGSLIFAAVTSSTADDVKAAPVSTVAFGQRKIQVSAESLRLEPEEFSVFDLRDAVSAAWTDLEITGLEQVGAAEYVPTLGKAKKVPEGPVDLITDNGKVTATAAEMLGDSKAKYVYYKASKDTYVVGIETGDYVTVSSEKLAAENAVEMFHLPAKLHLANFGIDADLTADMFGGKAKVTKDDIVAFIKPQYRVFRSESRKIDVVYSKEQSVISVAVTSGTKGAYTMYASETPVSRLENLPLGRFIGRLVDGEIKGLSFKMTLPKIPDTYLSEIQRYFSSDLEREHILQIVWSGASESYYIQEPDYEEVTKVTCSYKFPMTAPGDVVALTIHSHNTMPAIFSSTDNEDELYTGLYAVMGRLGTFHPQLAIRAGMEGVFTPVRASDVFAEEGGEMA